MNKRLTNTALAAAAVSLMGIGGFATPAAAAPLGTAELELISGTTSITIIDNGTGDMNPLQGIITYVNSNLNGWDISSNTTGTSNSPGLTPFGLDLTSLTATCTTIAGVATGCTTDPLTVKFSDTGFAVPVPAGGFTSTYSGTITGAGTTSQSVYFDNSNAIFGMGNLIGTVGPLTAPFGGGTATGGAAAAVPDYSLTLVQTFTDDAGGPVSFSVDGNVTGVPEPASLAIFGTALVGLGAVARRRRRKDRV